MTFNFDMPAMLGDIFSDAQLAGEHRVLPQAAPRAIGSFVVGSYSRASADGILNVGNGSEAAQSSTWRRPPRRERRGQEGQRAWD